MPAISAASILAKVIRDQEMCAMDKRYSSYGFAAFKVIQLMFTFSFATIGYCTDSQSSFMPMRQLSRFLVGFNLNNYKD